MKLGTRIKAYRKSKGLTRKELARELGYSKQHSIYLIETNTANMPLDKVIVFCDLIGVSLDDFIKT